LNIPSPRAASASQPRIKTEVLIFEQLNEAHTGNFNGVGLGLNIVRRYLDLMQGEISVQSEPGQGAKFTFSVPRSLQLNS